SWRPPRALPPPPLRSLGGSVAGALSNREAPARLADGRPQARARGDGGSGMVYVAYLAYLAVWVGGYVLLYRRYSATMLAYLRRFRPVAGVPLETQLGEGLGWERVGPHLRALWQVTRHPQTDPDLERLRRAVWRRSHHALLWTLGLVPLLTHFAVTLLHPSFARTPPTPLRP